MCVLLPAQCEVGNSVCHFTDAEADAVGGGWKRVMLDRLVFDIDWTVS